MQTWHVTDSYNCKGNEVSQAKLDEGSISKNKTNMSDYLNSSKSKTNISNYFYASDNKEDKTGSGAITNRIHNEFNYLFSGIGCFKGTFSLQIKDGSFTKATER